MAPDRVKEAICPAFDIHALYRHDQHQVTIWATITPATPDTIAALTDDPPDSDTHPSAPPAPATSTDTWAHLVPPPRWGRWPTRPRRGRAILARKWQPTRKNWYVASSTRPPGPALRR